MAPAIAWALTATTVTITASPSPATQGQPVTLTATPSVPGAVTFSYGGQLLGTGTATGTATNAASPTRQPIVGTQSLAFGQLAADASGNLALSMTSSNVSEWITTGGAVSNFAGSVLGAVRAIAISDTGLIYEGTWAGASSVIYKRTAYNVAATAFVSSGLNNPCGMAVDAAGNLYVANNGAGTVSKITAAGVVSTYASGFTSPCGVALNRTTGVLYVGDYIDATVRTRILAVPSGGGTPTTVVDAKCQSQGQLAIDDAGYLYARNCNNLSPVPAISQIAPDGTTTSYLTAGNICCSGTTFPAQNTTSELVMAGATVYVGGRSLDNAKVFGFVPTAYRATYTYTPPSPGSYATGATLAPTNSGTYAGSSGSGTLLVVPATPQAPDLAATSDLGTSSTDNLTSDATPTVAVPGTLNVGDTYTITATKSGSPNVQCTFVASASVTSCDLGVLANGTWSITATDTASPGGTSSASTALSVTIDTTAPAAPSLPDLDTASDTGTSSTDNVTGDSTPLISISGVTNGDTITVTASKAGSPDVVCTYVAAVATTGCTLGTLADGAWNITATATDPAGNTSSASSGLSVRVITGAGAAPGTPDLVAASDTGASSTDNITSTHTPTIDVPGISNGDGVTVSATNGATTVVCSFTAAVGTTGCQLTGITDGAWTITSRAVDPVGNTSAWSAPLGITVDSAAPSAPTTPDLATASDTGASSTDNQTSDATPTINVPSPRNDGDTYTVTAAKGASTVTCTFVASPSTTGCDLGMLGDGTWSITVNDTDAAGNQSTASAPLSVTIDTAAPSAPGTPDLLAASDTGSSSTDDLTGDDTPAIGIPGVSAGDLVTVTATSGGITVTCTYTQGLATSCDLPPLADGTWSITATATDSAGNTSPASGALSVAIDTTGPVGPGAPSVAPASDSGASSTDAITSDTTPEIIVPGGTNGDTITVSASDGTSTVSCSFVASPTVSGCTLPTLGPGDWTIVAGSNATDAAGNAAPLSPAGHLTVETVNAAPGLPDLTPASDTGASGNDNITKDTTPVIDIPGVKPGSTVTVVAHQAGLPDVTCAFVASANVTGCQLGALGDGTWIITASSVDLAGNQSPPSVPLSIFLDTAPPAPPAVPTLPSAPAQPASSGPGAIQDLGGDTRPEVGVDGGTPGDTITVIATNGTQELTCTFVVGQASSCRLPELPAGTWSISATATDGAGNVSRPSGSIEVRVAGKASTASARRRPTVVLSASTSRVTLRPREQAVITLRGRNTGKVTAQHVVLRVVVPADLVVVGQRASEFANGRVTFTVGALRAGTTATRQVIVLATAGRRVRDADVRARLSASLMKARSRTIHHRILPLARAAASGTAGGGAPVTG